MKIINKYFSAFLSILLVIASIPMVTGLAATYTTTVKETGLYDGGEVSVFISENTGNNLLVGLTPILSGDFNASSIEELTASQNWSNLTDGNFSTNTITEPKAVGNKVSYTYELDSKTKISDLVLVCEGNNRDSFGVSYEIYVADTQGDLYNTENKVYEYINSGDNARGGQWINFDELTMPEGKFIGFNFIGQRCADANYYAYRLSELGVYGKEVLPKPVVKTSNYWAVDSGWFSGVEIDEFIKINKSTNLLSGLTPIVAGELNYTQDTWNHLTDGDYLTTNETQPKTPNEDITLTYSLGKRVSISDLVCMSEKNNSRDFAFEYEVYVADNEETLYDSKNLVFKKTFEEYISTDNNGSYPTGAEWVAYSAKIEPKGSFVGFKFVEQYNDSANYYAYRLSELGVWGKETAPAPKIIYTNHAKPDDDWYDGREVYDFIVNNNSSNLLKGLIPEVNGDRYNDLEGGCDWSNLTDSNYKTFTITNPKAVSGGISYTFTLPSTTKISDLSLMCRESQPGDFAFEYEVYVGNKKSELYIESNKVFEKKFTDCVISDTNQNKVFTSAAEYVGLDDEIQPVGKYIGFKFTNQYNTDANYFAYGVSEIGVWGSDAKTIDSVVEDETVFEEETVEYNTDYLWEFTQSDTDGVYKIKHILSGLYLTMSNNGLCLTDKDDGSQLQLWKTTVKSVGENVTYEIVSNLRLESGFITDRNGITLGNITELNNSRDISWRISVNKEIANGIIATISSFEDGKSSHYLCSKKAIWGDVNGDNARDILDLVRLKKKIAQIQADSIVYDLDADGKYGQSADIIALRRVMLGCSVK